MQVGSQDFEITDTNHIRVTIQFNKAVDIASLALPQVVLQFESGAIANIQASAGDVATEAYIETTEEVGQLCTFNPDCSFTLYLYGSAIQPPQSMAGVALDGDNDGQPAGTYQTSFVIIG